MKSLAVSPPEDKPDIVPVVEHYTALKRAGRQLQGLCPLHAEKTPSFTVDPEKQFFYCHGCHQGGDVYTFVEKVEGLSFREAHARLGVQGEYHPKPIDRRIFGTTAMPCSLK